MADTDIPKFKTYADGEAIPPVDPEDLRRRWNIKIPWTREALEEAESHEADSSAVSRRDGMIRMLAEYSGGQLLAPWHHGHQLDDIVFRIAATFPLHQVKHETYMIAGDEYFGFDPNAFVQRLIEETGIAHVWEPVRTKVPEGGRGYSLCSVHYAGQARDPKRQAKRQTLELVWAVWKRFSPSLADSDKEQTFFGDFLMNNRDLVSRVEAGLRAGTGGDLDALMELERRAQHPW
jgi:hypothetical protein